jgi:ABC-type branched-subunit amino acid transport system substrate-binding protein
MIEVIQAIVRNSLNVVVFANRPTIQMTNLLSSPYTQRWLRNGSAAILYLNQVDTIPTFLPQGALAIHLIDATVDNTTAFMNKINAWAPGSASNLSKGTITMYDTIFTLGKAIESAVGFGPNANISPGAINASLALIDYNGFGGHIRFDNTGTRREQFSNVYNVQVPNTIPNISMRYDGDVLQERLAPIFPGPRTTPPDDKLFNIPIVTLLALTGRAIPAYAIPGYSAMYSFFVYWINQQPDMLPPNTKLLSFVIDNEDLPSNAVAEGNNAHMLGAAAIYGDFTPTMTAVIQSVVSSFGIPHMTNVPAAFLSNKRFYPTSMRPISSANSEGEAIVSMCVKWGWSEVTLITTSDGFGEQVFQGLAAASGITIVNNVVLDPANHSQYLQIMENLLTRKPRVIVALISVDSYTDLVRAMHNAQFKPVAVITNAVLSTNISTLAQYMGIPASFLEGWLTLAVPRGKGPAWDNFLNDAVNSPSEFAAGRAYISGLVGSAAEMDAYQVIASSIKTVMENGGDPRNGSLLLPAMKAYNGTLFSGYVQFDERGDRIPTYEVYNAVQGRLESAGTFSSIGGLQLTRDIIWPDGTTNVPLAVIPRNREWLKWSNGAGIALGILAALGIVTCAVMLCAIYIWRQSPVILTATWQFLILMLFGAALGFGSTFTWIGEPKPYICALRIWLPPIAFLLIIAPLMAKTWRLWKIFSLTDLKVTPVPLSTLIIMVAALVLIQVIICIFWISLGTIQTTTVNDPNDSTVAYVVCKANLANRICSYLTYGYIALVIVFGCYMAFKVRKLPKDFNESKWIGRTKYNIFMFAGLILILGYALNKQVVVVLILICVCTMAICYGSIFMMMAPKIFTLLKHPEKRSSSSEGSTKTTDFNTRRTHLEMASAPSTDRSRSKDGYSTPGAERRRSKDSVPGTPHTDRSGGLSHRSKETSSISSPGTSPSSAGNGKMRSKTGKEEDDDE